MRFDSTGGVTIITEEQLILGIDPGLNVTGYGLLAIDQSRPRVVEAGVLRTRAKTTLVARLVELQSGLEEILQQHRPGCMAVEELYSHYQRPRTAILMGHARGVLCVAAGRCGMPVHSYAATRVKRTLTGSGRAAKPQVQNAVCRELGLVRVPEPHDVADALAIALCHLHFSQQVSLPS